MIEGENSRNVGDYDMGSKLSEVDSAKQLARAEEFIELATGLLGSFDELESDRGDNPR